MRIVRFINNDVEDWSTAVYDAALSATSNWHKPPGIDQLLGAVVPTWAKIVAYIDAGGLEHVDIHKEPVAPREKRGRAVKRGRKNEDSAQLLCSVGPPGGDAGSSEREIRASTATIRPTNSGSRRKAEEAPVGPHTRNPRLLFARYLWGRTQETQGCCSHGTERFRVGRRRRQREKVQALLNRPWVTTNRGAGSVSWRGQHWRPNELTS